MEKALFFTGYAISHIKPIIPLIKKLKSENIDVYCLCIAKNKELIERLGVSYIEYPNGFWEPMLWKEIEKYTQIIDDLMVKKTDIVEIDYYKLKQDALYAFNYNKCIAIKLKKIIDKLHPNYVFRDSTDIYWRKLKKSYTKIKTIGYITNNLYSWDYLYSNPNYLIPHFLGTVGIVDYLPNNYIYNFKKYITEIFHNIAIQYNIDSITPYYQYNPNEDINIIYSTNFLQPKESLNIHAINYIFYPEKEEFKIENNIRENLSAFINRDSLKIVYISCGSFISKDIEYYTSLIETLVMCLNVKIIISCGNNCDKLNDYILNKTYSSDVFISDYIEQKYVLSKSNLFITSGGFNSIKESIYYLVPMLVIPITPEQRLNGLIIEDLLIGYTTYKKRKDILLIEDILKKITSNSIQIKCNLKKYKNLLKKSCNTEKYNDLLLRIR